MAVPLETLLLGAEVDIAPDAEGRDGFEGVGVVVAAWLLQPSREPITIPCYSVLMLNGLVMGVCGVDRMRVVKIPVLPTTVMVNPQGSE